MPVQTKTRVAKSWGEVTKQGTPDYAVDARRLFVSAGYELNYNEAFKTFGVAFSAVPSIFPQIVVPLASGDTQVLIDLETGLPMPYVVGAGYKLRILSDIWSYSERGRTAIYIFGAYYGGADSDTLGTHYYNAVGGFNTEPFDPTFSTPIPIQMQVENIGYNDIHGYWLASCILSAEGTPPFPDVKTVRCKFCEYEEEVIWETTLHKCSKCGETNMYMSYPRGRKVI